MNNNKLMINLKLIDLKLIIQFRSNFKELIGTSYECLPCFAQYVNKI